MSKFRKKPVVIEAFQFSTRIAHDDRPDWLMDAVEAGIVKFTQPPAAPGFLTIKTLEGEMRADSGDWIIRGVKGELYPCKPDIFEATYETECGESSDARGWEHPDCAPEVFDEIARFLEKHYPKEAFPRWYSALDEASWAATVPRYRAMREQAARPLDGDAILAALAHAQKLSAPATVKQVVADVAKDFKERT